MHGSSSTALIGEIIGANFDRIAAVYPERDAVIVRHQGVRWSYSEFADRVDRLARGLIASGLQPGDRMGIVSPNYAEWLLVQYASAKAGVILVNINPAYRTSELEYVLNQSGCRILVSARSFKSSDYAGMVEEVDPRCPDLERVVFLDSPEWEQLAAGGDKVSPPAGLQFDDPINIQYTSGTTGFPKGATLTHHNILNNGFFIGETCRYTPEDRVCIPVPFYHCFGMVLGNLACTTHGACMVIPAPSFEAPATLATVEAPRRSDGEVAPHRTRRQATAPRSLPTA